MDCWTSWYTFNNKPSIQTMTIHTIALMTCLLAILKSDDAAVYLKLKAIECTSPEIFIVAVFGMVITYISILTDLFLLVGIEDGPILASAARRAWSMVTSWLPKSRSNCRMAMSLFTWWNSFCISLQSMLAVGVLTSKVTRENFTVIIRWLLLTIVVLMIKSHYTRQVHAYYQHVKPLNTLQSMIKETVRITASNSEQQNKPGQS
ncbi:uncharacterized protein [Dermacentor albipictus]|uniref:uncharacterized protein isoform X4 n=1 Tax=Dermacentor albipictus TaxID=60249 RepID=UPI0038FC6E34